MTYANVQNTPGTRVTAGVQPWSVAKQYASNVTTGNMLVAIVSRVSSAGGPPTVGQVSDDQGNHWRLAVECSNSHYGVDMWICESCVATATKPTVTALQVGFPNNAMVGLNIQIMEFSGCSGFELVDQIGQAKITTTSVTVTSNYNLVANHELAISAIIGNTTAATVTIPVGWTSALADATQECFIAYLADTGGSSSGSTLSAAWTVLTADSAGAAILATFVQTGIAATSPHLVQSCWTDIALGGSLTTTKVSQPYPVNPKAGNLLIAGIVGAVFTGFSSPNFQSFPVSGLTDTAGNSWRWAGESGIDPVSGVDWCFWFCTALGGATILTATFPQPSEAAEFVLMEFAGYPGSMGLDSFGGVISGGSTSSVSTNAAILAGDIALAFRSYILNSGPVAPASGWKMIFSDTSGDGSGQMLLSTPAGVLTATFTQSPSGGDVDMLVSALRPSPGVGSH